MSGDLEITGGGAIAVDPEQMRAVADRMAAAAARMGAAADDIRRAHRTLSATWSGEARVDLSGLWATAQRLNADGDALNSDATGTGTMADAFELADLRARQEMLSIGRPREALALQERIDELLASYPELGAMAMHIAAGWQKHSTEGLLEQPADAFVLGVLRSATTLPVWLYASVLGRWARHRGTIAEGYPIRGEAPPVKVAEVARTSVGGSARSLTQLAQRIPGGTAQVAVEKRTHVDGSVSFVAYIDGTRDLLSGREDPWDMGSNWDLYVDREQSAAYAATMEALRQAGAEPGARVDVVGYSQGAAIAASVAMSDTYETSRVMILGSPVVPTLDPDQTLIRFFHTDDPVGAGLTAGGPVQSTGSAQSFTVSREYTTGPGIESATSLSSHFRGAYDQTIADADLSGDARVRAEHARLSAEAAGIVSVERMEFQATRP